MTVRISATDWFEGGTDVDDAVAVARAFAEHGADGDRRVHRPGRQGRAAGVRPQLPDAVRRPDPQRGGPRVRRRGDRRRGDLQLRRRQLDPARRPGRPLRARPPASLRPAVDAARRRRAGVRRARRDLARRRSRRAAAVRRPDATRAPARASSWSGTASRAPDTPAGAPAPPVPGDTAARTRPRWPRRRIERGSGHDRPTGDPGPRAVRRGTRAPGRARAHHAALGLPARHGRAVPHPHRADARTGAGVPPPAPAAHLAGLGRRTPSAPSRDDRIRDLVQTFSRAITALLDEEPSPSAGAERPAARPGGGAGRAAPALRRGARADGCTSWRRTRSPAS